MSLIPGSIPITGFIAPTDSTDTYAVTDALYGIDGFRNVQTYIDRNNISLQRRRAGMVVGVLEDNTYWRLKNQTWTIGESTDWEPFLIGTNEGYVKYFITSDQTVIIATNSQYWVYGDLTLEGSIDNYGQVIVANGSLIVDGGTFSNFGTLAFVNFEVQTEYIDSDTIKFNVTDVLGDTILSADVKHNGITPSHINTSNSFSPGNVLSTDTLGNFRWVDLENSVIGTKNTIALFTGTYSVGDSIMYQSNNTIGISGNLKIDGGGYILLTDSDSSNTVKIQSSTLSNSYELYLPNQQGSAGSVLSNDGDGNLNWITPSFSGGGSLSISDKNLTILYDTDGDMQFTGISISNTPIDNCYVSLFVNGQEFTIGDDATNSIAYFSNDGGLNARGFSQNHPNGKIQAGDELYWNESFSELNLQSGWRVSLHYISTQSNNVLSVSDKNLTLYNTNGNMQFSGISISNTPIDNSYVSLFINGQEFPIGNGITSSIAYFSNDGGLNARGFSQNHPNGKIQAGDELYWNESFSGINLQSGWRASLHYIN
jgi:hypothetical protein